MSSKIIKKAEKRENIKFNSKNLISISYKYENSKDEFTKDEIIKQVNKLKDKYKDKDIYIMVSVDTPYGFRSGKSSSIKNLNHNIFPETYEWDEAPSFVVYLWKPPSRRGGDDNENNDCLWECLKLVIGVYYFPKECKTPEQLKVLLNIKINEPIDISKMPIVENIYKVNINVIGDYIYTSGNKHKMYANLILNNGHYIINNKTEKRSDLLKNIIIIETNLIVCAEYDNEIKCYDGIRFFKMNWEEYNLKKYSEFKENSYINKYQKQIKKENLKETYDEMIKDNEKLKDKTKGRYDLSKLGWRIVNLSLLIIKNSTEKFTEPEDLDLTEEIWIFNSTKGALIFHTPNKLEIAYEYDKNSAYPSVLISQYFDFPITQGEYIELKELPITLGFGIYRVYIENSGNFHIDKLFRFNDDCYYTHFDLNCARFLGLKIELILNEGANFLYYKTRGKGCNYFKQIINEFYKFKQECKLGKMIINSMWGAMCEKNTIKRTTINKEINFTDEYIVNIKPIGEKDLHITYLKDKFYKHNYARIGTFLLAKVRYDMAKLLFPYKEQIVRFHTDGFISKIKIPETNNFKIGEDIGEWKFKELRNIEIINNNKRIQQ